ncbi:hypothetical protein JFV29_14680 [Peribacillus sp. TH16]|uniref:hypothetical protein n=1 Tax=Peribacillus TaxID=2675229 RepID=UPI0019114F25|nr:MULTISPECIES: hypothetical protein [unclassified Peribacillus]MBK5441706.1 hypothetical protein [Peribacillus sp. TH24]MBK5483111.1 hypothetical protein [Peribacillus sp. TH16]WMX53303.1 hypothetical protein RE409_14370 [Peribacillus sp. R9-11]
MELFVHIPITNQLQDKKATLVIIGIKPDPDGKGGHSEKVKREPLRNGMALG